MTDVRDPDRNKCIQCLDDACDLAYSAAMRLVTYADERGHWRAGVMVGSLVVDAAQAALDGGLVIDDDAAPWTSVKHIIAQSADARRMLLDVANEHSASGVGLIAEELRLGPPVPDPEKIICVGLNYPAHTAEFDAPVPVAPTLFPKFITSLIGPGEKIRLPPISQRVDWEGELAVVIGQTCKSVARDVALQVLAGCMPFNDVTARDLQMQTSQWMAGKALDTFAPCGPALVSLDELGDVQDLALSTRVNGEVVQHASTRDMTFSIAEIVAFVSSLMTLKAGDIIATGTPDGVGFRQQPPRFLKVGDVVEVEVEGVGTIANPVDHASDAASSPSATKRDAEVPTAAARTGSAR
jgi:2-keto-4-pentenoate hydratase/2-oxohepta-3-ene-1,7-dioic acid hydratase in catechol pathway